MEFAILTFHSPTKHQNTVVDAGRKHPLARVDAKDAYIFWRHYQQNSYRSDFSWQGSLCCGGHCIFCNKTPVFPKCSSFKTPPPIVATKPFSDPILKQFCPSNLTQPPNQSQKISCWLWKAIESQSKDPIEVWRREGWTYLKDLQASPTRIRFLEAVEKWRRILQVEGIAGRCCCQICDLWCQSVIHSNPIQGRLNKRHLLHCHIAKAQSVPGKETLAWTCSRKPSTKLVERLSSSLSQSLGYSLCIQP